MRNDLSSSFLVKMSEDYREPISLIVFNFLSGNVYLSDRDITIDGVDYIGLIESWGELTTSGGDSSVSQTMELSIVIWNGGNSPFSDHFLTENPVNVPVKLYQTFIGLDSSDFSIIGDFVIQDPIAYEESNYLLTLDLVTVNMRYVAQVGELVTKQNFPNALQSDLNKSIDLIIGAPGEVPTICSSTPPRTIMSGSILLLPTNINVLDDLEELGFLPSGFIQIDSEILQYTSRSDSQFIISVRGYGSSFISEHSDGSSIIQANVDIEYIVGQGPISSIKNVKVEGQVPTVPYTVHPAENPAVIRFQAQPVFSEYSKGARSVISDFDSVSSANTAYQPYYSFDKDFKSYGALISDDFPILAINQTTPHPNDGEVVKVFLEIKHWETALLTNDIVEVHVFGIGLIGYLSKPNPADIIEMTADINIDHGHDHETGGDHGHGFGNPGLSTSNPSHLHGVVATYGKTSAGSPYDFSMGISSSSGSSGTTKYKTVYFYGLQNIGSSAVITINVTTEISGGGDLQFIDVNSMFGDDFVLDNFGSAGFSGTITINAGEWNRSSSLNYWLQFKLGLYASYGSVNVYFSQPMIQYQTPIQQTEYKQTEVNTSHTSTGNVDLQNVDTSGKTIKDINDVGILIADNRPLQNIATTSSSKVLIEKFDLTRHLETVGWDWLSYREVQIIYKGNVDDANVIIPYINFEVEYRQRQVKTSDNITAEVTGLINNRPDAVIQYLLHDVSGLPVEKLGSVWRDIPKWDDLLFWDDNEIWNDQGEVANVPEGAAFEEAGSWFAFNDYKLDGLIKGYSTVKEAIQKITHQTRSKLYWQNGFAKLAISKDSFNIARTIGKDDIQFKSTSVEKSNSTDIVNKIDLFYDFDRLSLAEAEGAYRKTASQEDSNSIIKHGERKDDNNFLFDLIRDENTAIQTAKYYIWAMGETTTFINSTAYLNNFDIEKGDHIGFLSDFARLRNVPLLIKDIERGFGSGKLKKINTLNIRGESIRYNLILLELIDNINIFDNVSISSVDDEDANDSAILTEEIGVSQTTNFEDSFLISDSTIITSVFGSTIEDTPIIIDEMEFSLSIIINDSITIHDDILAIYELGYGSGGYGEIPYGSIVNHSNAPIEILGVLDEIVTTIEYNLELDDLVNIIDDVELWDSKKDTVTVSEELIFSSGYGSPVDNSTGYGSSIYGK